MIDPLFLTASHRRWNPLEGNWVLVSPHRTDRPWQGQTEDTPAPAGLGYDPTCYLCPGNTRAGGHVNPKYTGTFVFENDYAALKSDVPTAQIDIPSASGNTGLLLAETESGTCKVLCFDPRHDLTLATMPVTSIRRVVDEWTSQFAELAAHPEINYIQIFENRGAMMGASNPHPHCQIWATAHLPNDPAVELATQAEYFEAHGTTLLADYLALELREAERIVATNDTWVALVPFWAVWPFEVLVLPRQHLTTFADLADPDRDGLADILSQVTRAYNKVFNTPFPYSMGFHPAPCDNQPHPEWHLHAHFYPPLLRSATVRKFMVGFELLGSPQRDITPESAADTLRQALTRANT